MGLVITNEGADYSLLGLGYTDWVTEFLVRSNITDAGQKAAVRQLYASAQAAGIWAKLAGVCFFPGSTAATQKNIFRQDKGVLTFVGATSHSAAGFQPNTAAAGTAYADTGYALPDAILTNFSMGVYNSTPEAQSSNRTIMGVTGNYTAANAVGDVVLELSRYWSSNAITYGAITQVGSGSTSRAFTGAGAYDSTKSGFLQISKAGTAFNLIDQGTVISSGTASNMFNARGGTANTIVLGANKLSNGVVNSFSIATQKFAYWGALNLAECQAWQTIVQTFVTAFGR